MNEFAEQVSKLALSPKWRNNREGLANHLLTSEKILALYAIQVGIERCISKAQSIKRRILKRTIINTKPDAPRPGGVKYSVVLSKNSKRKLLEATVGLFSTWMVGDTQLGNAHKDQLLAAAHSERQSGKGHLWNAIWYETLAAPMNDTQIVSEHWESEAAVALIREEIWRDAGDKDIGFTLPPPPPKSPKHPPGRTAGI